MTLDDRAIAISANFTAEALEPGLDFWRRELGLDYEIRFAGYNQVFQQLLDPDGLFARNGRGVNVALVRLQKEHIASLRDTIRAAANSFSAPLIVVICPPSAKAKQRRLLEALAELPSLHTITPEEVL